MIRRLWCWLRGGHRWRFPTIPDATAGRRFGKTTIMLEVTAPYCARCGARMEG